MFKQRFLSLISNDFGTNGSDFLTASLPVHLNDSTLRLINEIGDTLYKKALQDRPQTVSSVTQIDSFTVEVTMTDTSIFTEGDYVFLEGNTLYYGVQYILKIVSATKMQISSEYYADITGLVIRTKLRHDVELAGAYFTAYDILPTLMQVNENVSIVEDGTIGQGSWHLGDINKRKNYLTRALEITADLTDNSSPTSLKFELI